MPAADVNVDETKYFTVTILENTIKTKIMKQCAQPYLIIVLINLYFTI